MINRKLDVRKWHKCSIGNREHLPTLQGEKSHNNSLWECSDCSFQCDQDDKIDSFDFDEGFNLDEVYDQ